MCPLLHGPLTSALSVAYLLQAVPNDVSETLPSSRPSISCLAHFKVTIHIARPFWNRNRTCNSKLLLHARTLRNDHLGLVVPGFVLPKGNQKNTSCPPTTLYGIVRETRTHPRPSQRQLQQGMLYRIRREHQKVRLLRMAGSG